MVRAANQDICWALRAIVLRFEHKRREVQWFVRSQYGRTKGSGLRGQGLGEYREMTGDLPKRMDAFQCFKWFTRKPGKNVSESIIYLNEMILRVFQRELQFGRQRLKFFFRGRNKQLRYTFRRRRTNFGRFLGALASGYE